MRSTIQRGLMGLAWLCPPVLGSCGTRDDGASECDAIVWARPDRPAARLGLVGAWDDWNGTRAMEPFVGDPSWQLARLSLPAGEYGYLVVEEGTGRIDRHNGLSTFRESNGQEVSLLVVESCREPRARVEAWSRHDATSMDFEIALTPAKDGSPIEPSSVSASEFSGSVSVVATDEEAGTATLRVRADTPGKHALAVTFTDDAGRDTDPVGVTTWVQSVADEWSDGILYQVVIDRFRGDDGSTLAAPDAPGGRAGGTLFGVTAALRDGYFEQLGVSALWLSPVYVNPVEAREGRDDDHLYEGYHGYWPLDSRGVDARIGGEDALHGLVAEAHARGIRVLLDLVPNHLYEDNPRVSHARAAGWFNEHDEECVCGSPTCPWADFIMTCWFTPYLPDLKLEHPDALAMVVDDTVWWRDTFDVDGFRIDAVPMMPRAATRRIAYELRQSMAPRSAVFTIGEIFTGAGEGGTADIRYHLGPDGLDSAFDFPLMWALRGAVATGAGSFADVEASLAHTDAALDGSGAESQLGRMIGNHDVTRFASEIAGDAGRDGWTDPAPQSTDAEVYERQRIGLGVVLTLPGLPVIYYGDEVALAGGSDPDNRRVMPGLDALSDAQVALLDDTRRLATLRRCLPALRQGLHRAVVASAEHYAYVRDAGDGAPALVVVSTADEPTTLAIPIAGALATGPYVDALGGAGIEVGGDEFSLELSPRSIAVYVPAGNACL